MFKKLLLKKLYLLRGECLKVISLPLLKRTFMGMTYIIILNSSSHSLASDVEIPVKNLSLSDLGTITEDIVFEKYIFLAGTSATELLKIGDFYETLLPMKTLGFIFSETGLLPQDISLNKLPFLKEYNFFQLASFIPNISQKQLIDIPVLSTLVHNKLGTNFYEKFKNETIFYLLNQNNFTSLKLKNLKLKHLGNDLSLFSVDSLPGLNNLIISDIPNWPNLKVTDIPGLEKLPFDKYINISLIPISIFDIAFGEKEADRLNSISGSYQDGFDVSCDQSSCIHIELGNPYLGKQWISGKSQWVNGGSGCLAGKEPTGRNPLGSFAKVVLTDTDEGAGSATFSLYFRFSIFCGTSPYFIGPFPFYQVQEKDLILIGF